MDIEGPAEAVRKRCGKYERNSSNPTAEGFLFFYFKKCNLDRKKSTAAKAGVAAMLPSALHRRSKLCERLVGERFRLQTQCWHNVDLQCYHARAEFHINYYTTFTTKTKGFVQFFFEQTKLKFLI